MILIFRKYYISFLLLLVSIHSFGQSRFQYPTSLSQFFTTYPLINPASIGSEDKLILRIGEQTNAGYFSRIHTIFALSEIALKTKSRKSHHALGLTFTNNKEGNLISFTRTYFQYAYHIEISEKWKLAAGISTGFLNLSIDQTITSGSVSSFAPDGSLGLYLYRDKEKIGFSGGQVLNQSIQVIAERIPIQRFYTFFYSRHIHLSPSATLIPSFVFSLRKEGITADLNVSMLLQNLFFVGVGYRYQRGSAYFIGLRNIAFLGGLNDFTVSYNAPWPAANLGNIQTFELVFAYKLKNKKVREDD